MELSLTLTITILTGIASFYAWNNPDIMSKWMFNPYTVQKYNEYHRFITSGFIHKDYIHLLFNLYVFYSFGEIVEYQFIAEFGLLQGRIYFCLLYLLGIIVSDIPTYLKHRNNSYYNSLGASGGVSSVLFSFILFFPMAGIAPWAIEFLSLPGIIWGAIYLIYSYFMSKRGGDGINHDAHFFGAAFGIIFTLALLPEIITEFLASFL